MSMSSRLSDFMVDYVRISSYLCQVDCLMVDYVSVSSCLYQIDCLEKNGYVCVLSV